MTKTKSLLACVSLVAAFAVATIVEARGPVEVRLIGINDFHGNIEAADLNLFLADPGAPPEARKLRVSVGGADALAGLVKSLRAGAPHSVFLAAGDLIGAAPLVSILFRNESTIEILNDMGLELSSLGNHEFDEGTTELKRVMRGGCAPSLAESPRVSCAQSPYRGARFRYVAANVVDAKGTPFIAPYVIKRFEGIPVAFIGGVTRTTPQMVTPSGVRGMRFQDEADAVNRAARAVRAKGVKAIVAIFHEGLVVGSRDKPGDWNDTTCPGAEGPILDIAHRLAPEIKVVFSGHTHQGYRCEFEGRLLIQGTSFGRGVSVVDIALDPATRKMLPVVRSYNLPVFNARTAADQREKLTAAAPEPFATTLREARPDMAIAKKVAAYSALAAPQANRAVGRVTGSFTRAGPMDSSAGRLIADAQLAATRAEGAQVAFMNQGGIRANIECAAPPCTVTFGQVFTMQPFGNSLVVMTISGEQIKQLLEAQQRGPAEARVLQPSEGFTYTWQSDAPQGERVRDMRLNGEPIDAAKSYRVTVNSFLAEGGDSFPMLQQGTDRKGGGVDHEALVAYLAAAERSPIPTPRITRLP